jgi:uncharacterized protein YbjT (DUF2867 family)
VQHLFHESDYESSHCGCKRAIGQPLTKELILFGHSVAGLAQSDRGKQILTGLGAQVIPADMLDAAVVEAAI